MRSVAPTVAQVDAELDPTSLLEVSSGEDAREDGGEVNEDEREQHDASGITPHHWQPSWLPLPGG